MILGRPNLCNGRANSPNIYVRNNNINILGPSRPKNKISRPNLVVFTYILVFKCILVFMCIIQVHIIHMYYIPNQSPKLKVKWDPFAQNVCTIKTIKKDYDF